ncbi:hypothetical protein Tco_0545987 [Tanacetum coccineum]
MLTFPCYEYLTSKIQCEYSRKPFIGIRAREVVELGIEEVKRQSWKHESWSAKPNYVLQLQKGIGAQSTRIAVVVSCQETGQPIFENDVWMIWQLNVDMSSEADHSITFDTDVDEAPNALPHKHWGGVPNAKHCRGMPYCNDDSEDTREISEITRKRMLEKMKSPLMCAKKHCPPPHATTPPKLLEEITILQPLLHKEI